MKYIKILLLSLVLTLFYISCERDDICAASTPTTPKLIIEPFNNDNQDNNKDIIRLRITGIDENGDENETPLSYINESGDEIFYDGVANRRSFFLPLNTNAQETKYILNSGYTFDDNGTPDDTADDTADDGNRDTITIAYDAEQVFVSRACGFKTIFKNVTITIEDDGDKWIELIQQENENQSVEDETATHFKLFH